MSAEDRVEMVTLRSLQCFIWGADASLDMVTMRILECFNWGAEDRVEMDGYIEWSGVLYIRFRIQGGDDPLTSLECFKWV